MKRIASLALGALAALTLAVPALADLRTSYSLGPVVFPGATVPSVRDVAVNNNPDSAWYGYVFVTDAGGPSATPQRRVMIFRPDPIEARNGATSYVDTGITFDVPNQTGGNGSAFAPFGVFVGPDDTVWVTNYDDRTVETIALPETVPASGSLGSTTIQIRMADFDAEAATFSGAVNGSSPRAVAVNGPVTNAKVFLGNYDGTTKMGQMYTVTAPNAGTTGTADHIWSSTVTSSVGPYGISADHNDNAYIPVRVGAGGRALVKVTPDGTVVPPEEFPAAVPAGYTDAVYASSEFVRDPSVPGGGYLYYSFRNGTAGGTVVLRYDLNGVLLDGFGAAGTEAVPNFTTLAITGSTTQYLGADDQGNVYQRYVNGSNSAVIKIFKKAPFVTAAAATSSATAPVKSSPTAVDGVVYFGADDGRLYAYTTADGNPVAGFPVDINAYVGATVQLLGRPAVYFGSTGKAIYLTTSRGDVVKVNPDGTPAWKNSAFAGSATNTATAPAVTTNGQVIAAVNGPNGVQVVKLAETDGSLVNQSPILAPVTGSVSSPAVELLGARVYVGTQSGATGDLWLLNGADLTTLTSFASGEGVVAPPHVKGIDAYVGTLAGNLYKVNSSNMALDPVFGLAAGTQGRAAIGEPLVTDAFPNTSNALPGGVFYVGSSMGKVFGVNAVDGAFTMFYDTGDATAAVGGLVINRPTGTLAFGTSAGKFYQMPLLAPSQAKTYPGYGAIRTTPTVDRSTNAFLVGADDNNVYSFTDAFAQPG